MHNDLSRRGLMVAGVAAALAPPLATLTIASASQAEDWPEFAEFVALMRASDAGFNCGDEDEGSDAMVAADALERAMQTRTPTTARHEAMLVAIAIASEAKDCPSGQFDSFSLRFQKDGDYYGTATAAVRQRLLTLAARRITSSGILPECVFVFPEGV